LGVVGHQTIPSNGTTSIVNPSGAPVDLVTDAEVFGVNLVLLVSDTVCMASPGLNPGRVSG
jgi:hypothetical protein